MHAYYIPVIVTDVPVPVATAEEMQKHSEEKLNERKEMVHKLHGSSIKVYCENVCGNVSDELERVSLKLNPFAVVMGNPRGRYGRKSCFWQLHAFCH
jgi:hypothetical protein